MEKVKSFEDLLMAKTKIEYKDTPGIYFLFKGQEIVYIGQAIDVPTRIRQHMRTKTQGFDSYTYIDCDKNELNEWEAFYILTFTPVGNKIIPCQNRYYKQIGQIRTELGCTLSQVKKFVKEKNIKPIGVMRDTKVYYDIRDFAELCANGVA